MKRKVITTAAIAGILLLTLVAMPAGAEDTLEETVNTANASGGSGGSGGSGSGGSGGGGGSSADIVEIRGEPLDLATYHVPDATGKGVASWNAYNFAGFWYDLEEGNMSEELVLLDGSGLLHNGEIKENTLFYNTTVQYIEYEVSDERNLTVENGLDSSGCKNRWWGWDGVNSVVGGTHYGMLGWFAEEYVALNGQPDKLVKLVLEQG
ncbi:hypothetical protein B6V01_003570, partial [Methanosarcinales archaeon ex4572_44]